MYLTLPLRGFPLELCNGDGAQRNLNDAPTRWSKKFDDIFIH